MNQYRKGTVSLVNGSTTVIGDSSLWLANILPGQMFFVQGDPSEVVYTIADVISDTELTLNAPYGGETTPSANYVINRDKTLNSGFHVIHQGDTGTALLVSENFKRLDTIVPNIEAAAAEMEGLVEAAETAASNSAASAAAAQDAEENAEAAQTSAEAAATTATSAATTATTQAGIATGGATTATTQAGIATTKASEASDSAESAATSATAAETAEANAETAEANAEAAEANAEAAAATATTQAGIATTQAGIATAAAGAAQAAEANAETAEANAETAEENAEAAAASAAGSASAAATSASEAAASAAAAEASAASIDVSTYTQRAGDETVTGAWSFDNTLYINGWTTIVGGASIVGPWAQFELVGDDHSYSVTHDNANGYLGIWDQTSSAWRLMVSDATGGISMPTSIAATSTTTGTLVIGGGLGVGGAVHASSFTGSGSGLSSLDASSLSTGTVPSGRLSGTYAIDVSGNAATATTSGNADTVDGYHASAFGLLAGANTWTANNHFGSLDMRYSGHLYLTTSRWLHFGSSGSETGAIYANGPARSYGTLRIWGSKNGWAGLEFDSSTSTLMWNSTEQGAYAEGGAGWQWHWSSGTLAAGTVPYARLSGVGDAATHNAIAGSYAANYIPRFDGYGYLFTYYLNSATSNSENPGISQVITTNGSDNFYRKSSIAHLGASLGASAPAARTMGLKRRDDPSDYNVQTYWTGSYWRLYGYYGDSGHADTHVGYADSAGSASSATNATNATYSQYLWSTSHPGSYYVSAAWTGSHWQLTSNHGSPVRVGYADTAGNGTSTFSNSGTGYLIFDNGFKIMWGTLTTVGNNSYTITFPTSFSSYSRVMCSGTVASGNRQDNPPATVSSSTSSCVIYDCDDTSKTTHWLAVGY